MARIPHVTRTIKATHATLMCVDTETAEVFNKDVVLPRTYEGVNDMLKAAKKVAETGTCKVVTVVAHSVTETLYGMTEADFIKYAKPMPPRSTGSGETENPEGSDTTAEAPVTPDAPAEG